MWCRLLIQSSSQNQKVQAFSRLIFITILLLLISGCTSVLDSVLPNPNPFYVSESDKVKLKAKQVELETFVNAKIAQTTQGENILLYLKRVADSSKQDLKQVGGHKENWYFDVDFRLIDFVKSLSSPLAQKLELKPLENWFDAPSAVMEGKPDFWKTFILAQSEKIELSKVDSTIADANGYADSTRIFFSQHGKYYRYRQNSAEIYLHVREVSNFSFSEVEPEWYNRVLAAHKSRALSVHKQYTSIITCSWGDVVAMKEVIELIINLSNKTYQSYTSITENNSLSLPSYDASAIRVMGVISTKLGSQGFSESVVRVQRGLSDRANLMVRIQIAKDGTPLFYEWFNLGD